MMSMNIYIINSMNCMKFTNILYIFKTLTQKFVPDLTN